MKLDKIYEALDLRFSTISSAELRRELKRIRDPIATISSFDSIIQKAMEALRSLGLETA